MSADSLDTSMSTAELEAIYTHAPVGLCTLDIDLRFVRVNQHLADLTGAPIEAHIGRTVRDVSPALADRAEAALVTALKTGEPVLNTVVHDGPSSTPDGRRTWIESWLPLRSHDDRIIGLSGVTCDVTEHRRAANELERFTTGLELEVAARVEPAEHRSRRLQALAVRIMEATESERARVSEILHDDLQQLLASARLRLDAAGRSARSEVDLDATKELLGEAITIAARLSRHLGPTMIRHTSPRAMLEWLAHDMSERGDLDVELVVETDLLDRPAHPPIATFLFRALEELLNNVAAHAGVDRARVRLSTSDDRLDLSVTDHGFGFDADAVEKSAMSSNFGLLMLRERIAYLGGELTVDSAPGRGARVNLSIPIRIIHPSSDSNGNGLGTNGDGNSDADGVIRVLVVDDHRIMRQGLINLLADQSDLEVLGEASDGLEAVEETRRLKPDVVLMDVSMPRMGGVEATRRIKEDAPSVRVVGLTMHDDGGIARAMQEAGAEAFVSKTASSGELLTTIRTVGRIEA